MGSGFAGSLLARVLTVLGYDVVLLERGRHPRFAIGESSTPLANLSLERIGIRYGLPDCYHLATHGRWIGRFPELRRGLKRGFTFYRHHPGEEFENRGLESERLLVAASPEDSLSDTHWFRADVDHHFVREAVDAGVEYCDHVEVMRAQFDETGVSLSGTREDASFHLRAAFVIDASGPGGFLARQLAIPSAVARTHTRSSLVFSHFDGVQLMKDVVPGVPAGPYPDDWAAVHHVIDEGWMYSLRFDDGVTSAGFLLTPSGLESIGAKTVGDAESLFAAVVDRYPTLGAVFASARATKPIAFHSNIQHRLTQAAGERWLLMPHAYSFVDPLFSTGIAWSLRAVERIALEFERLQRTSRTPDSAWLTRYGNALSAEADQIDRVVAGAYEAMSHFDLFAAQAMLYFAVVSFAEASQRLEPDDSAAWNGFLGVADPVLDLLPAESLRRLRALKTSADGRIPISERGSFCDWMAHEIAPRNVAGLARPDKNNLYPADFEALVDAHDRFGMTRDDVVRGLPRLRGMGPIPSFDSPRNRSIPDLATAR